ncbi:MAG: outer membrane protein assembly factor BamC [Burkholderiaceae bacterium]|nr:outer membrane protein assembly factor BamC [Burkholderiaceae bacterium]
MHVVSPRGSASNARRAAAASLLVIVAAGLVAGCSSLGISTDKVDYKAVPPQRPLDLPPDLPPPPTNDRFTVPGVATASGTAQQMQRPATAPAAAAATSVAVAPTASNARIERAGAQRWLAVDLPPEQAFAVAREFWGSVGIKLEREDPAVGILETEWAENRAKIPQDIIRRTIGKVFDGLYSTGERDKFRTRIERTPKNTSEVFISHRGMIEVYTTSQQDQTKWQPRPADPELEAEMLQRLLLRFAPAMPTFVAAASSAPAAAPTAASAAAPAPGSAPAAAASVATVAPTATAQNVRMITGGDGRVARLEIDEPFDRAWRRVGLGLDRGGFTVEDRNRTNGVYFVRYLDPEFEAKQRAEQGVLSKLFGGDPKIVAQQFRVQVGTTAAAGATSTITLLDRDGKPEASATGDKILRQLSEQIR